MSAERLGLNFYRVDAATLARRLLGQRLVRVLDTGERLAGIIVEAEAYVGVQDRASHAFGGRRTTRTETMYARAGVAYVYFTYGMHHMFNVVCGEEDEPPAVLVRALRPTEGLDAMRRLRPGAVRERDLCSGPGKLCEALAIHRRQDGTDLTTDSRLFIERVRSRALPGSKVSRTPRIGVDSAGEWATAPLRWLLTGDPNVSRAAGPPTLRRPSSACPDPAGHYHRRTESRVADG